MSSNQPLLIDFLESLTYDVFMVIVTVYVKVKPECINDFIQATELNASASRKEPGIARFDVIQQMDDDSSFLLIEAYRSENAPAAHKETEHYQRWRDTVADMMAEPRSNKKYKEISPDESGW